MFMDIIRTQCRDEVGVKDSSACSSARAAIAPPDFHEFLNSLKGVQWIEPKPRPANIFQIAKVSKKEAVASNILAFFFDSSEQHGMGNLFGNALLNVIGKPNPDTTPQQWSVETEDSRGSDSNNRVDITVVGDSVAFVIENKVDAPLYNDLVDYESKVVNTPGIEKDKCHVIVLHPHEDIKFAPPEDDEFIFTFDFTDEILSNGRKGIKCTRTAKNEQSTDDKSDSSDSSEKSRPETTDKKPEEVTAFDVTYDDLFDEVKKLLGEYILDADTRCVEILKQFIENTSEKKRKEWEVNMDEVISVFTESVSGNEVELRRILEEAKTYIGKVDSKLNEVCKTVESKLPEVLKVDMWYEQPRWTKNKDKLLYKTAICIYFGKKFHKFIGKDSYWDGDVLEITTGIGPEDNGNIKDLRYWFPSDKPDFDRKGTFSDVTIESSVDEIANAVCKVLLQYICDHHSEDDWGEYSKVLELAQSLGCDVGEWCDGEGSGSSGGRNREPKAGTSADYPHLSRICGIQTRRAQDPRSSRDVEYRQPDVYGT
jgi:hypothetical protein